MNTGPRVKRGLKTSYKNSHSIQPLHTSGPVLISPDGATVITTVGEEVLVTDVSTGAQIGKIQSDTSDVTSMAVGSNGVLAVFTRALALRYYQLPTSSSATSSSTTPPTLSPIRHTPKSHTAPVLVSIVDPTSTLLASGSSDGIVKVWDLAGGFVTHMFKSHGGPVSSLCFNIPRSGELKGKKMELVTGSGDTKVRIFDLRDGDAGGKPKFVLDGHVSVVRGIGASQDGQWLVTGGRDRVVLLWDLFGGKSASEVLDQKKKGKGKSVEPLLVNTLTVLESLESVGVLEDSITVNGSSSNGKLLCYTGGERGVVRVWDVKEGREVVEFRGPTGVDVVDTAADAEEDEQKGIVEVLYNQATSSLISVHSDQNILFHSLPSGSLTRQLVGYNDEIIDALFLSPIHYQSPINGPGFEEPTKTPDSHLALATNSSLIRIYSTKTFDARLLPGHTDTVLCLDRSNNGEILFSGSKDKTVRAWGYFDGGDSEEGGWKCIAICEGHAETIGSIAVSRKTDEAYGGGGPKVKFIFSASQDRTVKMWDLSALGSESSAIATPLKPKSLLTQKIHEKDINSIDLAPNDRFLASGSQDKLVKVFEVDYRTDGTTAVGGLNLIGTCKGHKRGVWSVKFSKTDRVLASGSGDKTVKIWSLEDFSCLKTFEGHTNSVLRVDFLSYGMQVASSSSDGLVKLWNVKDEECVTSLDNHEDKIWALTISQDEKTIVSGAADSVVTFWGDATAEDEQAKTQQIELMIMNEQNFANFLNLKDYRNAILLALAMAQPGRLLSLFTTVAASRTPHTLDSNESTTTEPENYTGNAAVDRVIKTLPNLDLVRLLRHVRDWNSKAKTSHIAQIILYAILRLRTADEIVQAFEAASTEIGDNGDGAGAAGKKQQPTGSLKEVLAGLIPYTERHFARSDRLFQESFTLDYALSEMDGGLFGGMDFDDKE